MREFEQMDIDGIALCDALTERGISLTEASKMLYRSVGYMSVVKSSGKIRKGDYKLLKMTLKDDGMPFTEEEMDKIEKKVKTPEEPIDSDLCRWNAELKVERNTWGEPMIVIYLYEDGKQIDRKLAYIQGDDLYNFTRAISWAGRCLWKAQEGE